jgi:dTDP-4-dehydrorhamnose 3,5-epimerase
MGNLKWGLELNPLKSIGTGNGDILRGIKKSDNSFMGFGEAYFSCIFPGSVKGWKCHRKMTLNFVVPVGSIKFVIFKSNRVGQLDQSSSPFEFILGREQYSRLTIPPGLWVGFCGLGDSESVLLNVASHEHDPLESDNIDISSVVYKWD